MQISRHKVKEKEWGKIWDSLLIALQNNKKTKLQNLLVGILAPTERIMMAKRLMVGILTLSDWKAGDIANQLKLSRATVRKFQILLETDKNYGQLLRSTFPGKVKKTKSNKTSPFETFMEDLFKGRRERWRMYR